MNSEALRTKNPRASNPAVEITGMKTGNEQEYSPRRLPHAGFDPPGGSSIRLAGQYVLDSTHPLSRLVVSTVS